MGPKYPDQIDQVQQHEQDVIQSLYNAMLQVNTYDLAGKSSASVLISELTKLSQSLQETHAAALLLPVDDVDLPQQTENPYHTGNPPPTRPQVYSHRVPTPLIEYVEAGRNPDIYTREFVELVRRSNQETRGKVCAFREFRDILAREIAAGLPECADDVRSVVDATGGTTGDWVKAEGQGTGQETGQGI